MPSWKSSNCLSSPSSSDSIAPTIVSRRSIASSKARSFLAIAAGLLLEEEVEDRQCAVVFAPRDPGLARRLPLPVDRPLPDDRLEFAFVEAHPDSLAGPQIRGREERRPSGFSEGDGIATREDRERAQDLELGRAA